MFMKRWFYATVASVIFCALGHADSSSTLNLSDLASTAPVSINAVQQSTETARPIRGIHLTASAAGSKRFRKNHLDPLLNSTVINTVIVDIKEEDGYVYVPGVKMAEEAGAYARDIPDLKEWLADMKRRNVYTIARVVAFKDNKAPRHFPAMGVHRPNGQLWEDRKHMTWLDPYNTQAWRYDMLVALQAAKVGFDEIQFDYIRFPTDGDLKSMKFAKPYSITAASQALSAFLHQVTQLVHPLGAKVSIDVFGLTTSVNTGMGIGQKLPAMAEQVDFVCPMTYPSHYAKGEYGIPNPNDQPYRVIHLAMRDAIRSLGPNAHKLRPYFQDFSLKGRGIRYGAKEVRDQIQAAADLGVMGFSLWNARSIYTLEALRAPIVSHTPVVPVSGPTKSAHPSVEVSTVSK
jgi:hypothetical protein